MTLREAIARRKIARAKPELDRPYDPGWMIFRVRLWWAAVLVERERLRGSLN